MAVARAVLLSLSFLTGACVLLYPLIFQGYLNGHDIIGHVFWAQQFLKSLHSGLLSPQWITDAHLGCGSPAFIFYPPLVFYTYAGMNLFTKEILPIMSLSAYFGLLASGISMYFFCRTYFSRFNALFSSFLYMALPYHLIDLYTRSAMAEFWAFAWIPALFTCAVRMRENPIPYCIGFSLSYAGLLLTHLPTALLLSGVLFFHVLFLSNHEGAGRLLAFRLLAFALGFGLSSFYLLPAIAEQQFVNIGAITGYASYRAENNLLFGVGTGDSAFHSMMGRIAVSTALIPALSLVFRTFRPNSAEQRSLSPEVFFALVGVISFLMMLPFSKFFWEFPLLENIQFPWRLLTITSFVASVSAGFLFRDIARHSSFSGARSTILLGIALFGLITLNGYYSGRIIGSFNGLSFDEAALLLKQHLSIRSDSTFDEMLRSFKRYYKGVPSPVWLMDALEYRPLWSIQKSRAAPSSAEISSPSDSSDEEPGFYEGLGAFVGFPPFKVLQSIQRTEAVVVIPREMRKEPVIFDKGSGSASIVIWEPEHKVIHVRTAEPGQILIRTFYYPRWKAYVRGNPLAVSPHAETGLIHAAVPQGEYDIELRLDASPARLIGGIASAITVIVILVLLQISRKQGQGRLL